MNKTQQTNNLLIIRVSNISLLIDAITINNNTVGKNVNEKKNLECVVDDGVIVNNIIMMNVVVVINCFFFLFVVMMNDVEEG